MARKKEDPQEEGGILITAAKAIGTAAGKVASMTGAAEAAPKKAKTGKLQARNKQRLPRKAKKAQKKAAQAGRL